MGAAMAREERMRQATVRLRQLCDGWLLRQVHAGGIEVYLGCILIERRCQHMFDKPSGDQVMHVTIVEF